MFHKFVLNNAFSRKMHRKLMGLFNSFRYRINIAESEEKLAHDNHNYWNRDYSNPILAQDAHWINNGKFEDHQVWLSLGKEHLKLLYDFSSLLNINFPVKQIVEWGCGGGANAVHFAPLTEKFIGIDITSESLTECERQLLNIGLNNFFPIKINASLPEAVLNSNVKDADLFICTYVYELFPSSEYGMNILKLANSMLKKGGIAFVHIRYNDGRESLKSKKWGYNVHPYIMTTYTLEEFWERSKECGFEPICIYMKPYQPLVNDKYYAYYFLKKV